jgi:L-iditol 2-dehydrogenase
MFASTVLWRYTDTGLKQNMRLFMLAARLYAPRDLRIEEISAPPAPAPDQVILKVTSVGICGSDLHTYMDARIGDTVLQSPLVLGHEFAGVIAAAGEDARDGNNEPLRVGQRVAVDPATPCYHCEMCEQGHPNLCRRLHFHGLYPDDGALQQQMICAARSCYPVPDVLSDDEAALLEPLGVAIHAVDLGKLRLANSVVVIGCGPIGLLIIRLASLSGAQPIYAFDCHPWRVQKALAWGADKACTIDERDAVAIVHEETKGRGVDVVFEAAWADQTVGQAAEMARLGGRVVLVGIPSGDELQMRHSTARRKGLTLMMSRRMKHTYPRAIALAAGERAKLKLNELVSHRFGLRDAPEAFAMNADYHEGVHKIMIDVQG